MKRPGCTTFHFSSQSVVRTSWGSDGGKVARWQGGENKAWSELVFQFKNPDVHSLIKNEYISAVQDEMKTKRGRQGNALATSCY